LQHVLEHVLLVLPILRTLHVPSMVVHGVGGVVLEFVLHVLLTQTQEVVKQIVVVAGVMSVVTEFVLLQKTAAVRTVKGTKDLVKLTICALEEIVFIQVLEELVLRLEEYVSQILAEHM